MVFGSTYPFLVYAVFLLPLVWIMLYRSGYRNHPLKFKLVTGGLRSLTLLLLILAVADLRLPQGNGRTSVFFLVDVSESIGRNAKEKAFEFVEKTSEALGREDRGGLIVFGRDSSVETDLTADFRPGRVRSQVNGKFTNIYKALQTAVGRLPIEGRRRIVLLSDGNQTEDDAVQAAYLAFSLGIPIYPAPIGGEGDLKDISIEELISPDSAALETPFEVKVAVSAGRDGTARLSLFRNRQMLSEDRVMLEKGKTVFRFRDILRRPGLYLYKALVDTSEDTVYRNNTGLSFTQGEKKSQVLYLTDGRESPGHFARALEAQGMALVMTDSKGGSGSLLDLMDYDALILDNIPASSLSPDFMDDIEKYVRDLGGGLIMIGGDKSFGAGQYGGTPIENALPVLMDVPATLEIPSVCLVLVIDKSASMAGSDKLEGAKIAAFSSVELLNPMDRVGLLAFDSAFEWIVPVTRAGNRPEIARQLSSLKEGGGTDLFPGLEEAFRKLRYESAAKKHVIVLSDGLTNQADFQSLVLSMKEAGITVSTVAVGNQADLDLMRSIAEWGGGRGYFTEDADQAPRIFVGETRIATERVVVEKEIRPSSLPGEEILSGLDLSAWPILTGMVTTHIKPGARIVLDTEEGPLLAVRQYGLGRSLAFTSDLSPGWCRDWVAWDHYGRLASQMVKWTVSKTRNHDYRIDIARRGGRAVVTIDVTDKDDRFVNHLALKIKVTPPRENGETAALEQIAPGRYSGEFTAEDSGEYYLSLFTTDNGRTSTLKVLGYPVPYPEEYRNRANNYRLLDKLAEITGGRVIDMTAGPDEVLRADSPVLEYRKHIRPHLVLASFFLLVLELVFRKTYRRTEARSIPLYPGTSEDRDRPRRSRNP